VFILAPRFRCGRRDRWCLPGRRAGGWSCSSASGGQVPVPLGSIAPPPPARTVVVVLIVMLGFRCRRWGPSLRPIRHARWSWRASGAPVRVEAVAFAGAHLRGDLHRRCSSVKGGSGAAVGVDGAPGAGADVRGGAHGSRLLRWSVRQGDPMGSMPHPSPARTLLVVFIAASVVWPACQPLVPEPGPELDPLPDPDEPDPELPIGQSPGPSPARTFVVLRIARLPVAVTGRRASTRRPAWNMRGEVVAPVRLRYEPPADGTECGRAGRIVGDASSVCARRRIKRSPRRPLVGTARAMASGVDS
jgi:hypothetical protein